jgi:hypothetical protein
LLGRACGFESLRPHSLREMRCSEDVAVVLGLGAEGFNASEIARRTGIPRATVRDWLAGRVPRARWDCGTLVDSCGACGRPAHRPADLPPEYIYLLGLYLGDGCISAHRRGVYRLRVILDLATRAPSTRARERFVLSTRADGSIDSSAGATSPGGRNTPMSRCRPTRRRGPACSRSTVPGASIIGGSSSPSGNASCCSASATAPAWPGALRRLPVHEHRASVATPALLVQQPLGRHQGIFCDACDLLDLHWTTAGHTIYVSRKADVAVLDEFIGPKA